MTDGVGCVYGLVAANAGRHKEPAVPRRHRRICRAAPPSLSKRCRAKRTAISVRFHVQATIV